MIQEEWRAIPEWHNIYEVSSHGNVRRVRAYASNKNRSRIIKPWLSKFGYRNVSLYDSNHRRKNRTISRLVASAFLQDYSVDLEVDHINRIRNDDRLCNLRMTNRVQNCCNTTIRKSNTTGYLGVSFHKIAKKFSAQIRINGKIKYLGLFATAEEAAARYERESYEREREIYA